jgi:exopolysaccharide biosynthesis predicted pyruvyltransferase EpsI
VTERLELDAFLAELGREPEPILYVPNPGNAGDAMIAHATVQLLGRLGIGYEWVNQVQARDPMGRVVVYGGGGNLAPFYSDASRALRWAHGRAKRIILLPHTIDGHEELLAELGPETDLICRELASYEHVRRVARSARCHLADDVAFSLDVQATLACEPPPIPAWSSYARKLLYRLMLSPSRSRSVATPGALRRTERLLERARGAVLHAFRTDFERTNIALPPDNRDVADLFSLGIRNANVCHITTLQLLRYLDLFDEVRTNRLHVAIGAALLGKRVEFHPNSYFKNRAVFEFSLRDRFPLVKWMEPDSHAESPR